MAGGGGGKQTTTESKEIRLPAWVEQASQENYKQAQQVANRPYAPNPWGGEAGVAGLDPLYEQARGMLSGLGDYSAYGGAQGALQGMLGYNPTAINAGYYNPYTVAGTNLDPYLNPWRNEVEANTVRQLNESGDQEYKTIQSDAQKNKAFGGSRMAVQQGVQQAETTKKIGDTVAALRQKGFDTATGLATGDVAQQNAAAAANASAYQKAQEASRQNEINAITAKTGAAGQATTTADAEQSARMNEIATALGLGQIQQDQSQRVLDAKSGEWQNERNYPLEQLNILMAALGMSPYGHTETGTSTTKSSGGGGGIGSALGMAGGLLRMLPGLSDERTKTDIEYVGPHPDLPIALYAYRYKNDPKRYPKVVGPMAKDVERVAPHLVRKVGKRKVVDLSALTV